MSTFQKLFIGCGALVIAGFVSMIALVVVLGSIGPDPNIMSGGQLSTSDKDVLSELNLLEDQEEIIYFYSNGLSSIRENGNFFTDKRAVVYGEDFEVSLEQATYDQIADITLLPSGTWLEDSMIVIKREDETEFFLEVTTDSNDDRKFYNRLVKEWKKNESTSKK